MLHAHRPMRLYVHAGRTCCQVPANNAIKQRDAFFLKSNTLYFFKGFYTRPTYALKCCNRNATKKMQLFVYLISFLIFFFGMSMPANTIHMLKKTNKCGKENKYQIFYTVTCFHVIIHIKKWRIDHFFIG